MGVCFIIMPASKNGEFTTVDLLPNNKLCSSALIWQSIILYAQSV